MYSIILFDLDGTLTASGEGITKCVQYALGKFGIEEPDLSKLECFVGPPLMEQFMNYAGLSEEEAIQAVEWYRERYSVTGIFENRPYEGIPELLQKLKDMGYLLGVASSKPEGYVRQILEHFDLKKYFRVIVGSEMNGRRVRKSEVIEEALRRMHGLAPRSEVVMIGDKEHDVLGARACGLDCIAVGYGYGTEEELFQAKPRKIIHSVEELAYFFVKAL